MAADVVSASTEFDIFPTRPVQTSTHETIETSYKPIASLDQSDLEFLIPADHDTYIDLNIQLYIRGKLTNADGTAVEPTDHTCVVNNFLQALFEQCNISLKSVTITHAAELYRYRTYLDTFPTVAMRPLHSLQTRSSIVIPLIRAFEPRQRLSLLLQSRVYHAMRQTKDGQGDRDGGSITLRYM